MEYSFLGFIGTVVYGVVLASAPLVSLYCKGCWDFVIGANRCIGVQSFF
jgi:hypothetical protein